MKPMPFPATMILPSPAERKKAGAVHAGFRSDENLNANHLH